MNAGKPNIMLVVVTVLSLAFGIYGFLFGGVVNAPPPRANQAPVSDTPEPGRGTRKSNNTRKPDSNTPADTTPTPIATPTVTVDTPSVPEVEPATRGDGSIDGTVVDPQGTPLKGTAVTAVEDRERPTRNMSPEELVRELERLKSQIFSALTDDVGRFRIEGLSHAATYRVTATHEKWGDLTRTSIAGQHLYLQFEDSPITSGTVEDEAGQPIETVEVAWRWNEGESYSRDVQAGGRFIARWRVSEPLGFALEFDGYQASQLFDKSYQGRTDLRVVLRKAPQLEVAVKSPAGQPVVLASVRIMRAKNPAGEEVEVDSLRDVHRHKTDMRGRVLFHSLPVGTYELSCSIREGGARADTSVELTADTLVELTLDPGPALTVRVLNAEGKPVPGTNVTVRDLAGEYLDCESMDTGVPGEKGLLGLPAALIQLEVSAGNYPSHWIDVDLTGGGQALEVVLKPGGRLHGKVTDGNGTGLRDVLLMLISPGGAEKGRSTTAYTDRTGAYKTEPLLPGTWTVELYRDWMGERLAMAPVTIAEGENTQDFTLDSVCVVKVVIEYDEGMSGDWCRVWIQPDGSDEPQQDWVSREDNNEKRISLKAGTYTISASTDELASAAREVELTPGETTVRLRMARPNALRFSWIEPGSELAKAGIKTGDVLLEYNGQPVTSKAELNRLVEQAAEVNEVAAVVMRGKKRVEVKMPKIPFHYWLEPAAR